MSNGEPLLQQPAETQTQLDQPLTAANSTSSLRENVETAMANYFKHLDGQPVSDVYQMVMSEIEAPLLEQVMKYVRNNQTKAAHLLGLNRGTLRKKLKQYGLL
ncbi:MAG TPA: DNA-binding transcriptional regulator Fis [Cellvibrionales bacterium]|jgi:Fis family transcriptional regulator|nr:DNA-binding transcriptional regulator Fis [Cellvibrionales bacterium]|tara:strand:- start:918 stop:1226 length:309 start_codon:yes stop_codon:yes gene_type:complete